LEESNKKLSSSNNNLKVEAREWENILAFWVKPFVFARGVQKFMWNLRFYPRYPEGFTNLFNCISEKIVTVHTNKITFKEKGKKLEFWNNELQNEIRIFWQNLVFWGKLLFQRAVEKVLWTLRTRSMYLKDSFNLALCVSEKIVILRYTTQIIFKEIWKKLRFWKNEAQICSEYSNKTKHFEAKLLFQRQVKNFLCALRTCSRYLDGSPNIVLCVSEKIGLARHFNQNISRRKAKWGVFTPPHTLMPLRDKDFGEIL